ncbi:hypothetical protein P8452_39706 [Trifolium repens]|nr:hypothetical protein P8452_39706 [Trifolium repens]
MMMMMMFLKPSHTLKPFNYIAAAAMSSSSGPKRRTIHVISCSREKPRDKDPKDFYMRTLTTVLGSEEAAKKAYITDMGGYRGFSAANLTPEQADQISSKATIYFFCL